MKINIKATGIDLTPSIQEYVEKRIETIEKFVNEESSEALAEVEVGLPSRHHKSGNIFYAEINLSVDGKLLTATATKDDLYAAIDEMRDTIERECISHKNRKKTLEKKGDSIIKKIMRGE